MNSDTHCTNLKGLLTTERAAIRCHLDTSAGAGHLGDRREAVRLCVEGYGGLMRDLYCAHICSDRGHCEAVRTRRLTGDLVQEQAS